MIGDGIRQRLSLATRFRLELNLFWLRRERE